MHSSAESSIGDIPLTYGVYNDSGRPCDLDIGKHVGC